MFYLLATFLSLTIYVQSFSVDDFGAIRDVDSAMAATRNAQAFQKALMAAVSSETDREVLIPEFGVYFFSGISAYDVSDITVRVDGTLRFSDDFALWGTDSDSQLLFENTTDVVLTGKGTIDGQGLKWWRMTYTGTDNRPKLVRFRTTRNSEVSYLTFLNSPTFHVIFEDSANVVIHDITIFVDSHLIRSVPTAHEGITYPLNTDGLDIRATNVTVYNCNITNYDDAIVAKPCQQTGKNCQCSGNMLVYNNSITYSTGLTIGSVSPGDDVNCVRNVTFRDNYLFRPLKAIYIKPNPKREGDSGSGIIDQISYENIRIEQAVWWTIWIGPQQMNQPGEAEGTGCNFLFPFIDECPTQPLVSMTNIKLKNVTAVDTLPLFEGPGVILCDESLPCTRFDFSDVTNTMFEGNVTDIIEGLPWPVKPPGVVFPTMYRTDDWEFEYITKNVYGNIVNTKPTPCFNDPDCFTDL
mmetsp:Transcript_111683/g.240812  ORF Transcript_111683/g.240812 Transcript_111683/m.240812 type:complete len:467 (+) Transcript_111683:43-1443(+)